MCVWLFVCPPARNMTLRTRRASKWATSWLQSFLHENSTSGASPPVYALFPAAAPRVIQPSLMHAQRRTSSSRTVCTGTTHGGGAPTTSTGTSWTTTSRAAGSVARTATA